MCYKVLEPEHVPPQASTVVFDLVLVPQLCAALDQAPQLSHTQLTVPHDCVGVEPGQSAPPQDGSGLLQDLCCEHEVHVDHVVDHPPSVRVQQLRVLSITVVVVQSHP